MIRGRWFLIATSAFLIAAAGAGRARAQTQPVDAQFAARSPAPAPRFAFGASFGFLRQADLGGVNTTRFIPSLIGLAYVNLAPRWYLRPGVRLGLAGLGQPAAAADAHVEEHGVQGRAEVSLLYDGWLIPALGVGTGLERRNIDFVAKGTATDSGALDRIEWLGSVYVQAGLGVPLFHGVVVVEPYGRWHHIVSDDRSSSELGFDVTFAH